MPAELPVPAELPFASLPTGLRPIRHDAAVEHLTLLGHRSAQVLRGPLAIAQPVDLQFRAQLFAAFPAHRLKALSWAFHRRQLAWTPLDPITSELLPKTVDFLPLLLSKQRPIFKKGQARFTLAQPPPPELPHLASREIFSTFVSHLSLPPFLGSKERQRHSWFWPVQAGLLPICATGATYLMSSQSCKRNSITHCGQYATIITCRQPVAAFGTQPLPAVLV